MSKPQNHTIMDGKVHIYRRPNTRFWQCSVYLGAYNHRASTKHDNLALALEFARDWYMERYADERLRKRALTGIAEGAPLRVPDLAPDAILDRRRKPRRIGPTFRAKSSSGASPDMTTTVLPVGGCSRSANSSKSGMASLKVLRTSRPRRNV